MFPDLPPTKCFENVKTFLNDCYRLPKVIGSQTCLALQHSICVCLTLKPRCCNQVVILVFLSKLFFYYWFSLIQVVGFLFWSVSHFCHASAMYNSLLMCYHTTFSLYLIWQVLLQNSDQGFFRPKIMYSLYIRTLLFSVL